MGQEDNANWNIFSWFFIYMENWKHLKFKFLWFFLYFSNLISEKLKNLSKLRLLIEFLLGIQMKFNISRFFCRNSSCKTEDILSLVMAWFSQIFQVDSQRIEKSNLRINLDHFNQTSQFTKSKIVSNLQKNSFLSKGSFKMNVPLIGYLEFTVLHW